MGSITRDKVALVFGASGIFGWAVTRSLLEYPTPSTFSRVVGLTHRPQTRDELGLPDDPRLEVYSGINLRADLDEVMNQMHKAVPQLDQVTHVYYLAYSNATAYTENVMEIKRINVAMTYNAVHASDKLCRNLTFFNYGVAVFQHLDKLTFPTPLKENAPRVDLIREAAQGKRWGWCEVRPDAIIGHVPSTTSMTTVKPIALYLSLYRYVNGPGATVPFPGTLTNYTYIFTDSSQDIISRAEIYLSVVKPEEANGEAFNIADTATPSRWSDKWPILTDYFGLKATGPTQKDYAPFDQWWNDHQDDYDRMCKEYGLKKREIGPETWIFVYALFKLLDRNREFSLDKIRNIGFTEERPVGKGHIVAFGRLATAQVIPSRVQLLLSLPDAKRKEEYAHAPSTAVEVSNHL
ncbi:hypothetical protein BO94DRAFT_586379 [Aspergillus sclerotioniger CBS 115572]|uniref:PRISE-like Rossmann-fold domain-containing protein n=1 Tax=Aspergillus sclerotioniger CBS 115572 TaxID=1450535 RepID=A0A317WJJ0_9EURO|nr:hypothetical protein BO94DRAFT_586379 [Aspergillus sclerotioniger CBS 115572]PWY85821.1 hypothetical protein BO94DRAFT_586379 [Aspergillus sclerotioniger CBS 115572]